MNFMFSWQEQYLTRSLCSLVRYILFLPLEHKIHIFSPPCNILYIFSRQMATIVYVCPWKRAAECVSSPALYNRVQRWIKKVHLLSWSDIKRTIYWLPLDKYQKKELQFSSVLLTNPQLAWSRPGIYLQYSQSARLPGVLKSTKDLMALNGQPTAASLLLCTKAFLSFWLRNLFRRISRTARRMCLIFQQ